MEPVILGILHPKFKMESVLSVARKFVEYKAAPISRKPVPLFPNNSNLNSLRILLDEFSGVTRYAGSINSSTCGNPSLRRMVSNSIIEALRDVGIKSIGVYGPSEANKTDVITKVSRIAKRDNMFDVIVNATLSRKSNLKKVQEEIARVLDLRFEESAVLSLFRSLACEKKIVAERAKQLRDRIKKEKKILVILCDVCEEVDLEHVGIPVGADHSGCKILITSSSEEVLLSNQMINGSQKMNFIM